MKTKVTETEKVNALIQSVNGKAGKHTFNNSYELEHIATISEQKLESLGLAKKYRKGAIIVAYSGRPVAKSYSFTRKGNKVTMTRGANDWFISDLAVCDLYTNGGGKELLNVTKEQDAEIVKSTRSHYSIIEEGA